MPECFFQKLNMRQAVSVDNGSTAHRAGHGGRRAGKGNGGNYILGGGWWGRKEQCLYSRVHGLRFSSISGEIAHPWVYHTEISTICMPCSSSTWSLRTGLGVQLEVCSVPGVEGLSRGGIQDPPFMEICCPWASANVLHSFLSLSEGEQTLGTSTVSTRPVGHLSG